jgi:hypothetical protein
MSWRDELQFWPRPPIPEISGIIRSAARSFTTCCAASSRRATRSKRPGRGREMPENQSIREEFMDPDRLKGKNILITGAARGMGEANAEALPRRAPMSASAIWMATPQGRSRCHQRRRKRQGDRGENGRHQARRQRRGRRRDG